MLPMIRRSELIAICIELSCLVILGVFQMWLLITSVRLFKCFILEYIYQNNITLPRIGSLALAEVLLIRIKWIIFESLLSYNHLPHYTLFTYISPMYRKLLVS